MEQTALNLIAIGIFAITMSVLLGPLFNLSPAIPAIITFAILSLTTIDTLSWQNRGSTILLGLFSSREQKERILHHEAGHFLVAYVLGIPITGYTLSPWSAFKQGQPGLGGVTFDSEGLIKKGGTESLSLTLERFSTVLMAGIAAEDLIYGNAEGGEEDRFSYRQLVANLTNTQTNDQKERWYIAQAKGILQRNQTAYEVLVEAMRQRVPIEECFQKIQKHIGIFQDTPV